MLDSPVQAAPSQVASGAQLTSCPAWRQGAVAQAVQIPKQTPEGSRRGLLDSLEHTYFSQLAARKPLLPLAGPGDVVLLPRLIWILKRRELRAPARGLRTETQALGHRSKQHWELPDCLWVHTRSPSLPGDRALWPWQFRSQSRHPKAPAGACWIHRSTQTSPRWPPGSP